MSDSSSQRLVLIGAGPLPEPDSPQAPGVANRLWHFVAPALDAGHACRVILIEPRGGDATGAFEPVELGGRRFEVLRVSPEACLSPGGLAGAIEPFDPHLLVGAGTLLAGWAACRAAGERPVWVDLFGDPLAEIQAKADVVAGDFKLEDYLHVWKLMNGVLHRADAFSTVSRRQVEALLGELAMAGRLGSLERDRDGRGGHEWIANRIHPMPCAVESMDLFAGEPAPARAAWLAGRGFPEHARLAIWSGGWNAWADPDTLVEGLDRAFERNPDLFMVATGGELHGYLVRVFQDFKVAATSSQHSSRAQALGWLPLAEAGQWLRVADLGLLVDRPCAETRLGARNRLIYHAAARQPVLATRGTVVVADMEAAGAVHAVDPGDPEALAEALVALLADPAKSRAIGEAAFDFCARHYTFEATTGAYLAFAASPARAHTTGTLAATGEARAAHAYADWLAGFVDLDAREAEIRRIEESGQGLVGKLFGRRRGVGA